MRYEYGFEMTSGDDGKGPWHISGTASYNLENSKVRRPSVIEQAKQRQQLQAADSELHVEYIATTSSQRLSPTEMAMGVVKVSPAGNVSEVEGQADFSLIASSVGRIIFEQLPPQGEKTWKATHHRQGGFVDELVIHSSSDALNRFSGLVPISLRSTYPYQSSLTIRRTLVARFGVDDQVNYELLQFDDTKAVVKSTLSSVWNSGDTVVGRVEGEGQYTFDRAQGVITAEYGKYKLQFGANGIEATVPFQLAFTLSDALTNQQIKERTEKNQREAEEQSAKSQADSAARSEKQQQENQSKLEKSIATLKKASAPIAEIQQALSDLDRVGISKSFRNGVDSTHREEIAKALNPLLKRNDDQIRSAAVRAAQYWATATNIPALLEALESEEGFSRSTTIRALAATGGNDKSAAVLAKLMETNSRYDAATGLIAMKQFAEPVVLPLLQSTDSSTRREACRILGDVGGEKSRQALEAMMAKSSKDDSNSYPIKQALERIKDRLAVKSK